MNKETFKVILEEHGLVPMTEEEKKTLETHRVAMALQDVPGAEDSFKEAVQKTKEHHGQYWDPRYTDLEVVQYEDGSTYSISFRSSNKVPAECVLETIV